VAGFFLRILQRPNSQTANSSTRRPGVAPPNASAEAPTNPRIVKQTRQRPHAAQNIQRSRVVGLFPPCRLYRQSIIAAIRDTMKMSPIDEDDVSMTPD
jgi:hypothetical protein